MMGKRRQQVLVLVSFKLYKDQQSRSGAPAGGSGLDHWSRSSPAVLSRSSVRAPADTSRLDVAVA